MKQLEKVAKKADTSLRKIEVKARKLEKIETTQLRGNLSG